jgi:hypothetical protein
MLDNLNKKLEGSPLYQFSQRHKRVINIVEGLLIIGLLISINIYVVKDYFIKQQIRDNCGYTTSKYSCICEEHYVKNWQDLKNNKINISLNLTDV